MMLHNTFHWLQFLEESIKELNNLKHSRIKLSANEITKKNEREVFDKFYQPKIIQKARKNLKYRINDFVRIANPKFIFGRSYDTRFSALPYKIVDVNVKHGTYKLQDHENKLLARSYYEKELIPTKFDKDFLVYKIIKTDKKNNRALVSFVGEKLNKYYYIDLNTISNPEKVNKIKKKLLKKK